MYKIIGREEDRGLTLIELLITIAVIAIVAAISIPVITNVIGSTSERVTEQTQLDIAGFIEKYTESGAYTYNPTSGTFTGYIDLNGDGEATGDEAVETLTIDLDRFKVTASVGDAPTDFSSPDLYSTKASDTFSVELVDVGGESLGSEPAPRVILTSNSPGWSVLDNGATITCDGVDVGSMATFMIDGVETTITKLSKSNIQGNPSVADTTCTSGITDMSSMFMNNATFNSNIFHWDVSNATNMTSMFANASAFNQNINDWDVSNITNMSNLFYFAANYNQPLDRWNVDKVEYLTNTFGEASAFNQDIGNWNTSSLMFMVWTFKGASSFNQDLSGWNVANVSNNLSFDESAAAWEESFKPIFG